MSSRFNYFIGKSSSVIYKLCVGEGTAKQRLIDCEIDIRRMLHASVPDELISLKEKIRQDLFCNGFRISGETGKYSIAQSLAGKRNSTASKIIKDIWSLHDKVQAFIDYP